MRRFLNWFLSLFHRDVIKQIAKKTELPTEATLDEYEIRRKQEGRVIEIDFGKHPIPMEARVTGSKTAYHDRGGRTNIAVEIPTFANNDKIEIRTEPKDINKRLWILADRRSRQPGRYQQMPV